MAGEKDAGEIVTLIKDYLDAYQHRDIEALASVVVNDDNFIAFGTDQGELWQGWEEFKTASEQLFGAMEEINWERSKKPMIHFSREGHVAWFVEELEGVFVTGGEDHECDIRISGVAEKRGDEWLIVQFHRSVACEEHVVPYLETHGVRFD
jgi:uncharacterized protein (TIGR02246 family)